MTDNIRAYLDAQAAYSAVSKELRDLAETLEQVGKTLKDCPERFIFSNVSIGLPVEVSLSRSSRSVDGNGWKTAAEIQQLLAHWHNARRSVQAAWEAIPPQDRQHLKPLSL
ncbi:hypothetical protein [Azospirillum argentinense]